MGKTKQYLERVEKEEGLGKGDRWKPKEGDNFVRILTMPQHAKSTFQEQDGSRSVAHKFACYLLDRDDLENGVAKVKLAFLPYTIFKSIADFEDSKFYPFDDYPMPYDLNVKATGAGKKTVEYTVMANPERTPISEREMAAWKEAKPIEDIVEKVNARQEATEIEQSVMAAESPEAAAAHNAKQAIRNKAEMIPAWSKLYADINAAKPEDTPALEELAGKIEQLADLSVIDEEAAQLLRDAVNAKQLNVEGIPF